MKLFIADTEVAEVLEYKTDKHAPPTHPRATWCLVAPVAGEQFWCPATALHIERETH